MTLSPDGFWTLELPTARTSSYDVGKRSAFVFVCETCGALVGNTSRHILWHDEQGKE